MPISAAPQAAALEWLVSRSCVHTFCRPSLHPAASSSSSLITQTGVLCALQALVAIHKPADAAELEAAKRRLAFEELLLLQLKLLLRREIERTPRGEADLEGTCIHQLDMMHAGRAALGFDLTDAQDRVLAEVIHLLDQLIGTV